MSARGLAMSQHDQDLALASRVALGDGEAAAALFQDLGPELFGYARKMIGDAGAAEDALQETLLGALRSIASYNGQVSLRAWAFGILRNKIADHFRRRGREPVVSSADPEEDRFRADGHWKDEVRFQPWDERAELLAIVQRCLEDLPHNQREALMLRALEGLSTRETAGLLEVSEDNLRQILHRARAAVRRCAEQKAGGAA